MLRSAETKVTKEKFCAAKETYKNLGCQCW